MNDNSDFVLHILDIFHFQGIICSYLYSLHDENFMELPIVNGCRSPSNL